MKYVQNRDIKKRLVANLRLLYQMYTEWANEDLEVIGVSGDNAPKVHEQYPWNAEKYPIVVIGGSGGNQDDWAIDSFIQDTWQTLHIGQVARTYMSLASGTMVAFGIKSPTQDFKLRNVDIAFKGQDSDYDVQVVLMSVNGNEPGIALASGTISALDMSSGIDWHSTELYAQPVLANNTDYFVRLNLVSGSYGSYYLMIDDDPNATVTPFVRTAILSGSSWSVTSGSTPLARVNGPAFKQFGGGVHADFSILIEAKDLATTQKISELTFVYLNLLRHTDIQRDINVDFPNTTHTQFDRMAKLADTGITVISVRKGNETVRERGNDRLFAIILDVACYGRWTEVYEFPTIKEIGEDIESY